MGWGACIELQQLAIWHVAIYDHSTGHVMTSICTHRDVVLALIKGDHLSTLLEMLDKVNTLDLIFTDPGEKPTQCEHYGCNVNTM